MNLLSKHKQKTKKTASDTNARILNFLREQKTGMLATIGPGSKPRASVIYIDVDSSFSVRFLTKKGTRKTKNLRHNNNAMLVVYDAMSQTTAQVEGKISELEDLGEIHDVFRSALRASLRTSENGIPPISKLEAGDYVAFVLKPASVQMAVFSRPESGSYDSIFEAADLKHADI